MVNPLYRWTTSGLICPCGCGAIAPYHPRSPEIALAFLGVRDCEHRALKWIYEGGVLYCNDCAHTLRPDESPFGITYSAMPQNLWLSLAWWQTADLPAR